MRDIAVYIIYDLYDRVFVHLESGIDDHARLFILREIGVKIEKLRTRLVRVPAGKPEPRLARYPRRGRGDAVFDDLRLELYVAGHVDDRDDSRNDLFKTGVDGHVSLFLRSEVGVEIEKLRARLVRVPPRKRISRLVRARRRLGGVRNDVLFQKQLAVSHIGDRRRIGGGPCAASVAAVAASVTVAAAERTAGQCERKHRREHYERKKTL